MDKWLATRQSRRVINARVAELVDAPVSKAGAERREGSSPSPGTKRMKAKQKYADEWGIGLNDIGYDRQYDAYYDKRNGRWLERLCGDCDCSYCNSRPPLAKIPEMP